MMPLDARFTSLPTPANDTRPPDDGEGARAGAGNPFAGLLDELGRGTGGQPSADPRGLEETTGASMPQPDVPVAPAEASEGGTDLSRLIARALTRSGGMAQGAARPAAMPAPTLASLPQAERAMVPDTALAMPDQERAAKACALDDPTPPDVAEAGRGGLEAANDTARLDTAGMVALLVCIAPPSAGRTGGAVPDARDPDTQSGASQTGTAAAPAPAEDMAQDAPRLVAKVLDVQTHFAPIRSLVSTSDTAATRVAAGADSPRTIAAPDTTGPARSLSSGPALPLPDAIPVVTWKPAGAPQPRPEAGPAPILTTPRATQPSATRPTVDPLSSPQAPAPLAAPSAAAAMDTPISAGTVEPDIAAHAIPAAPDRPARRAELAAASLSGTAKAPEAAPGTHPSEPSPVAQADGERSSSRDERRDERAASAPIEAGAGRGTASAGAPAGGPMTPAAPTATAAVAGAISEAASRLVRANAGADLTAAPRPGDPVRIMEIAISPEGLGKVTVRLRLTSDGLEVRVRASDAGMAALLQQDKAQLAGILREFGCSEDRMDVSGPDGGAIGASTGADLRAATTSSSDESRGDSQRGQQGDRSQGGFQGGSQGGSGRNEGRHDDQGSRNPARGAVRDPGFDAGFDAGLLDG